MQIKQILQITEEIGKTKTFGGLHKTDLYSAKTIQLINQLDKNDLNAELLKTPNITVDQLKHKEYYDILTSVISSIQEEVKAKEIIAETNLLPIKNNDILRLDLLKDYELKDIYPGKMLEVYDKEDENIGKAIIFALDKSNRYAKLKLFITKEAEPKYAVYDNWWSLVKQEVSWTKPELLETNELGLATLYVEYYIDKYKLGRVEWSLYFTETDKDEALLAKGVDLVRPGLIYIQRKNALFQKGYYRLVILDRRKNITAPSKKVITWNLDTPSSKLESHVK